MQSVLPGLEEAHISMSTPTRRCKTCGAHKALSEFYSSGYGQISNDCKQCFRLPELTEARKRKVDAIDRRLKCRISPKFSATGD